MSENLQISSLLWSIAHKSDEGAFEELYLHYYSGLFHFALSFTGSITLAEEVVSDTFVKIWLIRTRLTSIKNFKAYLYKTARNIALNSLDSHSRKKAESLENINVSFYLDEICPETEMITSELQKRIEQIIESLPPKCKMVYRLAKVEGLRYKEIGKILSISDRTVENQVAIALRKIAEELSDYFAAEKNTTIPILLNLFLPGEKLTRIHHN